MPKAMQNKLKGKSPRRTGVKGASQMQHRSAIMTRTVGVDQKLAFPPRLRRVLRYADSWYLTAPTGSTTYRQFCVNGLYDFDITGTGHQPRSYDQLVSSAGPYLVYRVLGVKLFVEVSPMMVGAATPPAQQPVMVCAGFSTSGTNPTAPSGSTASNIWPFTEIPGWTGIVVAPGGSTKTMTFDRSMASIFGVPQTHILGEDNYQGVYNANPADPAYFYITYQVSDYASSGSQSIAVNLTAEFDVQFENPLFQANS